MASGDTQATTIPLCFHWKTLYTGVNTLESKYFRGRIERVSCEPDAQWTVRRRSYRYSREFGLLTLSLFTDFLLR